MTISEIAEMAGVSKAAVSRYFNNGYISEEKREAIRRVVEETGYQPSQHAAMLRTKKTKLIGVIAPKMASNAIGRAVEGIQITLNEAGYQVLLSVTQNNSKKELESIQTLSEQAVDGIILFGTIMTAEHKRVLKRISKPYVVIGQRMSGAFCVYHDDYNAMKEVTETIIEMGRKNIGYLGVMLEDKAAGYERYQGFCNALAKAGMSQCKDQFVISDFNIDSGYEHGKELFKKYPKLDALICATDELAVGAAKYLRDIGKKVPEDVFISGQGDSDIVRVAEASILSTHFGYEESGILGAKMLLEQLTGDNMIPREIRLGYYLVET